LEPGNDAPILLIGDSYSIVYASKSLVWGSDAGLPQHLMLKLKTPVQTISIKGGGATDVRRALASSPRALEHKRLVIWEFATRELYDLNPDWPLVALRQVEKPAVVTTGKAVYPTVIEARIVELAPPPQVKLGYPRAFREARVEVLKVDAGTVENSSLYVYLQA